MRLLERQAADGVSEIVGRVAHHNYLLQINPTQARHYWKFVERPYEEMGYEKAEFFELLCQADEALYDLRCEVDGI